MAICKLRARVVRNEPIADGIMDLALGLGGELDEDSESFAGLMPPKPGQFAMLYPNDESRLLGRPISVCDADFTLDFDSKMETAEIRFVYRVAGAGTAEFSRLKTGDSLEMLAPLGNGFPLKSGAKAGARVLVVGGGVGIPPLLFLVKELAEYGADVTAVLGYRDSQTFLADEFEKFCKVRIATDDGSVGVHGTVIDALRGSEEPFSSIYSCGPLPMLRAIGKYGLENEIPTWLSLEERMACGVGACLGCVVETVEIDAHSRVRNARVCKDGPVFPAGALKW